jgi:hypothetical protein
MLRLRNTSVVGIIHWPMFSLYTGEEADLLELPRAEGAGMDHGVAHSVYQGI